ncbi:hypothetical protein [Burkholderia stagnalis]|uniref:hypothetical protein n=1 Tax=Burkholderia stagnalis TaxID=1503054 RepID=UPI000F813120|nr:hypothetical protein [Burkholderia stagnalis]
MARALDKRTAITQVHVGDAAIVIARVAPCMVYPRSTGGSSASRASGSGRTRRDLRACACLPARCLAPSSGTLAATLAGGSATALAGIGIKDARCARGDEARGEAT